MYSDVRALITQHQGMTLDASDRGFTDIRDILKDQPQWARYHDSIKKIKISESGLTKVLCLFVQVIPGRWWRASWRTKPAFKCTPEYQLHSAFRHAVWQQIRDWKYQHSNESRCTNCASTTDLQADHSFPAFSTICANFVKEEEQEAPLSFDYHPYGRKFKIGDNIYSDKWRIYHASKSNLQWLCRKCNIAKGTKPTCVDTTKK